MEISAKTWILGIFLVLVLIPQVQADCFDFDPSNVPITLQNCSNNETLQVTRNLTIGNETCVYISDITCTNGCNNFTDTCKLFKGEQVYSPMIINIIAIIVIFLIFVLAIYYGAKKVK